MKRGIRFSILVIILFVLSVGCTKRETQVDRFYGTSYELAKQSQIDNPEAGVEDGPSVGLEGEVAASVIERYEKGFEKQAVTTEKYSVDVEGMTVK